VLSSPLVPVVVELEGSVADVLVVPEAASVELPALVVEPVVGSPSVPPPSFGQAVTRRESNTQGIAHLAGTPRR
jgi:hypothetical protein